MDTKIFSLLLMQVAISTTILSLVDRLHIKTKGPLITRWYIFVPLMYLLPCPINMFIAATIENTNCITLTRYDRILKDVGYNSLLFTPILLSVLIFFI